MRSLATSTARPATLRLSALVAVAGLLLTGCGNEAPAALVRREVAPAVASDPAKPCTREATQAATPAEPAPAGLTVSFDQVGDKIVITGGQNVTLPALKAKLSNPEFVKETAPGEWLVNKSIEVGQGASLKIAAPTVRWLKLRSDDGGFASVKALGGGLDINGACVTSWNEGKGTVDEDYLNGRSFLLARDGAQMTIDKSELHFLGFGDVESYGLSWRTEGSGGHLTNSIVSHLYFGLYTFDVGGLTISDNEVRDNVLYGIDPHTGSHNLTIERNIVHDNGKHGIILAEDCTDSVIRDNVVYRNEHHGIVLYLHSDRNLVEGNESFNNAAQGINVNESSNNTLK
jgi:parallel beta-helix repeat protein